ncbi:MAG: efflux RND transporter periplasmic adaptor subunit [Bacteroidota bacterium]|nr:efflux RND transporter periplasmic adaptor subunit [Bacteroidota bacterium]
MIAYVNIKRIIEALFVVLLLLSCGETKKKVKADAIKDYAFILMQPQDATIYDDYPATIQGEDIVEIRPMVDGYLEEIYVPEGAIVKKGQLLFKIKNPQYEQAIVSANAAIKIARADVDVAEKNVEKVKPLVEKEIVSKYELEFAQYTLQSKEAVLAQANANLANAKTNMEYTILHSPLDGVIGSIPYKIGALVSSTTANPLTTLSNISNIYAYFSMNEKQLLALSNAVAGNTLQEKLNHLPAARLLLADGSLYPETGKLETASGFINTQTGTASFKAMFPNPLGIINSGASATVRLYSTISSALLVPQSASYELQDKQFVYTLTAENRVKNTAIISKPSNDGQFLIVLEGLKKGDRVLINGSNLKDNTLVIPRPARMDSIVNAAQKN